MNESNIMEYVNNSFTFFKFASYILFLCSTECLSPIFHLKCTRWCKFTFLTQLVTKANGVESGTTSDTRLYHQRTNPHTWLMAWQWCHCLLASKTRQVRPGIGMPNHDKPINVAYSLCQIAHVNSKSGVNFQIALERNRVNTRVKRDLSVFIMHFLLYFAILYWMPDDGRKRLKYVDVPK